MARHSDVHVTAILALVVGFVLLVVAVMPSRYWQHTAPISCPRGHVMGWLGGAFWLCSKCVYANGATSGKRTGGTIYAQIPEPAERAE